MLLLKTQNTYLKAKKTLGPDTHALRPNILRVWLKNILTFLSATEIGDVSITRGHL